MSDVLKNKFQTIKLKLSNGASGVFIGRAIIADKDRSEVSIEELAFGPVEDFTDEMRKEIAEKEMGRK